MIPQVSDIDTYPIFSGEKPIDFDLTSYNFSEVKNLMIGTGVQEVNSYKDHTQYLQKTIDNSYKVFPNLENIYIFYTTVYFQPNKLVAKSNITFIDIPYFLLRSTLTDTSQFTPWNIGDGKAICLIGDIRHRIHKFPLLYHFYQKNKLDILNYSLMDDHYKVNHFSQHHMDFVVNLLNETTGSTFDLESFEILYNSLRKEFTNDKGFKDQGLAGIDTYTHFFPQDWNNSTCNLVLETCFFGLNNHLSKQLYVENYEDTPDKFYLSEKIWKPILSGKPFITISEKDMLYKELESLGFKTFLEYTDHSEKINIDYLEHSPCKITNNLNIYLELCLNRTESFLHNVTKYKENIIEDINHNMKLWKKISNDAWENVYKLCPPSKNMTKTEFCEMFKHGMRFYIYENWYEKQ